ncbi:MAG TPA: hypothetical protein ENG42_02190 [Candidatus Aenigmarchaeota archaeon]|nr:MAG: hypothetical protein DRP03_01475 [Candidatus Aenigmarchaeota archaeon]HDD46258.1 hypothetical protein [Candidatus Aenigmarchaeota archaeon]
MAKEMVMFEVEIEGMRSNRDAQHIQYNLLLNENIVHAHINFPKRKGILICKGMDKKDIVDMINNIVHYEVNGKYSARIHGMRKIDYEKEFILNMLGQGKS